MKTYAEKLRDPRWQRKRLEIMQRDNFACTQCGDAESTLNIHHWAYNGDPWEAGDENLSTVCENCHRQIETEKNFKEARIHAAALHLAKPSFRHPLGGVFRFLQDQEKIEDGDEFWTCGDHWWHFGQSVGRLYNKSISYAARRKTN